jgi:hypothetical protein
MFEIFEDVVDTTSAEQSASLKLEAGVRLEELSGLCLFEA